jgi:fucose permease
MGKRRAEIAFAFAGFIAIGLGGGATGVLLPAQISEYQVNKSIIGLLFFTFSAGYIIAGSLTGWLLRRLGLRGVLVLGSVVFTASTLLSGLRPPYPSLLLLSVLFGFGTGVLDATLNAFLTTLPNRTTLLNLLHAFYGVGALIGPLLASAILDRGFSWGAVYLGFAVAGVPLIIGYALLYPRELPAQGEPGAAESTAPSAAVFRPAIRHPAVLLSALFLTVYVGVEVSLGNWAFSFMIEERGQGTLLAGWVVSAFWLGFTLGRFVLGAIAERFRVGAVELNYGCLLVLLGGAVLAWVVPGTAAAVIGFVVIGAALGPVFPLTIAVLPRLAPAWMVPTAVGLLVGASVIGGALLPWLAGVLAEGIGLGSLLPFTVALTIVLLANWWRVARRLGRQSAVATAAD